jgi:hypothetical protein
MTDKTPEPVSIARRRARRLRITGVTTLLVGAAAAVTVYWLRTRAPDISDDPSMLGYNRAEQRQMGVLYGKQGELIEELTDDLKQPGTQAAIIIVAAGVVAAGCFYCARLLDYDAEAG